MIKLNHYKIVFHNIVKNINKDLNKMNSLTFKELTMK